ncbi:hypothetical protein CDIK_0974 [Cucumispora dikerogammari]|nr:hypothetical protein CDIK_0974 [Cucumispora dikerogammari]
MSFCFCYDSTPQVPNKTVLIIGNNDELNSKIYRAITGSALVFENNPTMQQSVILNNKRIIVTAIQNSSENNSIGKLNINFSTGVILVLDGSKDISQIEKYLEMLEDTSDTAMEKEQKRIFFCTRIGQNLIERIESLKPTFFSLEPEAGWFVKDEETNVYKFVECL